MTLFEKELDESSRGGTVAHAHDSSGFIHFHRLSQTTTQGYIILDLSNTTDYQHIETYRVHLDFMFYRIDADLNANYRVNLWVIDDINATDCTRTMVWSESGEKATDVNLQGEVIMNPYGPLCSKDIASTMIETGYTGYNTSISLADTITPDSATVTPGNGDLVLEFVMNNTNPIEPHFLLGYHTHNQFHP